MTRPERKHNTVMTGAEIIQLVETRESIRAMILAARGKVEDRIAAVALLIVIAALFRLFGWQGVLALVVYQIATGIKAYRNWKRITKEQFGATIGHPR